MTAHSARVSLELGGRVPGDTGTNGPLPTGARGTSNYDMCYLFSDTYCRSTFAGEHYKGHIAVTVYGDKCSPWKESKYWSRWFSSLDEAAAAGNYCRNPRKISIVPWCLHINGISSIKCNVPLCQGVEIPSDYQGNYII